MAEINTMIIAYFFLLCPGEYTASKSEITLFRLEYTAFICGRSVFLEKSAEGNLQAAKFVTLAFTTKKTESGGG